MCARAIPSDITRVQTAPFPARNSSADSTDFDVIRHSNLPFRPLIG
jgi:hypothetical protein